MSTYLGSHELRSTTESACCRTIPHILLAQTVITYLDMSVGRQKDIVKLQITVDDTILVEVLEC